MNKARTLTVLLFLSTQSEMSSAVQYNIAPSDVPAATPEGVFLVHNRACNLLAGSCWVENETPSL